VRIFIVVQKLFVCIVLFTSRNSRLKTILVRSAQVECIFRSYDKSNCLLDLKVAFTAATYTTQRQVVCARKSQLSCILNPIPGILPLKMFFQGI